MRKSLKSLLLATTVASASAFAFATAAEAALVISFDAGGGNIVTVADNTANDTNTVIGAINVSNLTVGDYTVTGTISQSSVDTDTNIATLYDLNLTTSGGPGSLIVTTTEDNFILPGTSGTATTSITPTVVGGTLDLVSTIAGTDMVFTGFGSLAVQTQSTAVSLTSPFSITHVATIDHFDAEDTTYDVTTNVTVTTTPTVPVPATLALFGAGLVALGWIGRRRA